MTARVSTSSVAGCARALLWMLAGGACASDSDELFSPLGPLPPEGAADMPEIAPPIMTVADPSQPGAPGSTSGELGPMGALPVDPATSSPRAEEAPGAPPAAPAAPAPGVDVNPAKVRMLEEGIWNGFRPDAVIFTRQAHALEQMPVELEKELSAVMKRCAEKFGGA